MDSTAPSSSSEIADCLKTISLDGRLLAMDPDGLCLMEVDDFADIAGKAWSDFWPLESRRLVTDAVALAVSGRVARFSADCPTAKGTPKSWDVSVAPIRDERGTIVALQSLSQDVTKRERALREHALVSRELAHRIKNLIMIIDGLIYLSSRDKPAVHGFVDGLRRRLGGLSHAIAFIHPMSLPGAPVAPRTVKGLISALASPYTESGARISIEGDDAEMGQGAVAAMAMVLNELATNAVKYGALSRSGGSLSIILERDPRTLVLCWIEETPLPADHGLEPGFGTKLLERTVRLQLQGTITRTWKDPGLVVRMELPLNVLADGAH